MFDIYLDMSTTILTHNIDSQYTLRILTSDIGYHFELIRNGKLSFGTYFLYGENTHKAALCLGGAVYGLLHDDELAEDIMKIIDENESILGGSELKR